MKKDVQFCLNVIYQKQNINRKKSYTVFYILKFNDICVSWSYPKSDQDSNLLDLQWKFGERQLFLNKNYLSKYLIFLYLLTYYLFI